MLRAVKPAKLNVALYNIAHALEGQGAEIGNTIVRLERYLSALNPHAETFGQNLVALADALESLQKNAPALLDMVDSALTTTRTMVAKEKQFVATLAGGATTSDEWSGFLDDNGDRLIKVIKGTRPVLSTMAGQSHYITASFKALGKGIRALNGVFDESGMAHLKLVISGSPFDAYTAADCPRYPGMDGANCGIAVASSRQEQPTSTQYGGTVGAAGSPEEKKLLDGIVGDAGDVGDLLLAPLLRGSTVVSGK